MLVGGGHRLRHQLQPGGQHRRHRVARKWQGHGGPGGLGHAVSHAPRPIRVLRQKRAQNRGRIGALVSGLLLARFRCDRIGGLACNLRRFAHQAVCRTQARHRGGLNAARIDPGQGPVTRQPEVGKPRPVGAQTVAGGSGDGKHITLGTCCIGTEILVKPRVCLAQCKVSDQHILLKHAISAKGQWQQFMPVLFHPCLRGIADRLGPGAFGQWPAKIGDGAGGHSRSPGLGGDHMAHVSYRIHSISKGGDNRLPLWPTKCRDIRAQPQLHGLSGHRVNMRQHVAPGRIGSDQFTGKLGQGSDGNPQYHIVKIHPPLQDLCRGFRTRGFKRQPGFVLRGPDRGPIGQPVPHRF